MQASETRHFYQIVHGLALSSVTWGDVVMQSILHGLLLHLSPRQGSTNLVARQVHVKGVPSTLSAQRTCYTWDK